MYKHQKIVGFAAVLVLLTILLVAVTCVDWQEYNDSDVPVEQPVFPEDDSENQNGLWTDESQETLNEESLSYVLFEKYGVILIPLAILLFAAMVGGVIISKEEIERYYDTD